MVFIIFNSDIDFFSLSLWKFHDLYLVFTFHHCLSLSCCLWPACFLLLHICLLPGFILLLLLLLPLSLCPLMFLLDSSCLFLFPPLLCLLLLCHTLHLHKLHAELLNCLILRGRGHKPAFCVIFLTGKYERIFNKRVEKHLELEFFPK